MRFPIVAEHTLTDIPVIYHWVSKAVPRISCWTKVTSCMTKHRVWVNTTYKKTIWKEVELSTDDAIGWVGKLLSLGQLWPAAYFPK